MAGGAWWVVTDVDHTLLEQDRETELAGRCLRHLHDQGISTLLASSKTFAELVDFQNRAGLPPQPFLFENGCGIGWPRSHWPAPAGKPGQVLGDYGAILRAEAPARLQELLREMRRAGGLRFCLLEELAIPDIRGLIGLEEGQALLAMQRLASVPLVWHDTTAALDQLRQQLAAQGLRAVCGGRLIHVAPPFDKAEGLAQVLAWQQPRQKPMRLLACGDSENDRSLLEAADLAIVFHPPNHPPLTLAPSAKERLRIQRTALAGGPTAWLVAIKEALAAIEARDMALSP